MEKFEITKGPDSKEQLTKNVVLIEGPNTKFRIAYGKHIAEQAPEDMGAAGALALETGSQDYSTVEEAREAFKYFRTSIQYKKIIARAEKDKKPIFFVDLNEATAAAVLQIGLNGVGAGVGFLLLGSLAKDFVGGGKITRRAFLEKSIKGGAGLYFLSLFGNFFSDLGTATGGVDEQSASRVVNRFLIDLNEKIHPEATAILLTLRNAVMARKIKTIADGLINEKNKKSDIAIVVGASHIGLERALQSEDKELVELIDKLLMVPTLKKAREEVATIARFDFDEMTRDWNVKLFKDPHLVPLEKK